MARGDPDGALSRAYDEMAQDLERETRAQEWAEALIGDASNLQRCRIMAYETLLYEKSEGITTVTFNRPAKLNALNRQVMDELADCIEQIRTDDEVKAVILTGAGEKAFIAGADISEL